MRILACVMLAAGCTIPPNVIKPNCAMSVTGVVPSKAGWVYCSTESADDNLTSFVVRDGDGNAIVLTAPGPGAYSCGKPNLEIELQFNGALQIAGCDPVNTCVAESGTCDVTVDTLTTGNTQAFSGHFTAFAAAAPMSSAGYNITLSGSWSQ